MLCLIITGRQPLLLPLFHLIQSVLAKIENFKFFYILNCDEQLRSAFFGSAHFIFILYNTFFRKLILLLFIIFIFENIHQKITFCYFTSHKSTSAQITLYNIIIIPIGKIKIKNNNNLVIF